MDGEMLLSSVWQGLGHLVSAQYLGLIMTPDSPRVLSGIQSWKSNLVPELESLECHSKEFGPSAWLKTIVPRSVIIAKRN